MTSATIKAFQPIVVPEASVGAPVFPAGENVFSLTQAAMVDEFAGTVDKDIAARFATSAAQQKYVWADGQTQTDAKPNALQLMGKQSHKGRGNGKASEKPKTEHILTSDGKVFGLEKARVRINEERVMYLCLVVRLRNTLREKARNRDLLCEYALNAYNEMAKAEEAGAISYEDFLRFCIMVYSADKIATNEFYTKDKHAIADIKIIVDRNLARMFPNMPKLPTEHGIWTELVTDHEGFLGDPDLIFELDNTLQFYINHFASRIKRSKDSFVFGPLQLSQKDLRTILVADCEKWIKTISARRTFFSRKEREAAKYTITTNSHFLEWDGREDIPLGTKEKMATVYGLGSSGARAETEELFHANVFWKESPEIATTTTDELYLKYKVDRFGKVEKEDIKEWAIEAERSPREWKEIPAKQVFPLSIEQRTRKHNISYTVFKRPHMFERNMDHMIRDLIVASDRNSTNTVDEMSELQRDAYARAQRIASFFLNEVGLNKLARSMIIDILWQVIPFLTEDIDVLEAMIAKYRAHPKSLYQTLLAYYKKQFPYADALFAQMKREEAVANNPVVVARKMLRELRTISPHIEELWTNANDNMPPEIRGPFNEAFIVAMVGVENDPAIFVPWIEALGELSKERADWAWAAGFSLEKETSPNEFIKKLQDLAFPPSYQATIKRRRLGVASGIPVDTAIWQPFETATAYLTNDEWEMFLNKLTALRNIIQKAIEERAYPETVTMRKLFEPENFALALNGLSNILSGGHGQEPAITLRNYLRSSLSGDALTLYSVFNLGRKSVANDRSALREIVGKLKILMDKKGRFTGDPLGCILRTKSVDARIKQGALAEHAAIGAYLDDGYAVAILPPDIFHIEKTPDLFVYDDKNAILIEVKSMKVSGVKENIHRISEALLKATGQIEAKLKRFGTNQRVITLFLFPDTWTSITLDDIEYIEAAVAKKCSADITGVEIYWITNEQPGVVQRRPLHIDRR